jgi:uncharacterized protein YuzE
MTIIYFAETDTLAVDLRDEPATETDDLTDDVLVDDNAQRQIVGLTIDQASKHVDLGRPSICTLPRSTCSCALALLCRPERPKDDPQQMLEPPDHIDWDMACVHCGKELGDEDEVAALDV